MARIELRHATIRIKDGFAGTALVNEPVTSPSIGATDVDIDNVDVNGVLGTDVIPVGARFTIATALNAFPTPAVVETQGGGGGQNEIQTIQQYVNDPTGGTWTLTIDLAAENPFTTAPIAYNASAATIQSAIDAAATAAGVTGWANGHIVVAGGPLTSADVTLTYSGLSVLNQNHALSSVNGSGLTLANEGSQVFTVTGRTPSNGLSATTNIQFTPALVSDAVDDNDTITFLPQQIEVTVGDGNLTYTENRELDYELDRGELDSVRQGDDQPMEITLDMVYEFVTTGTGETITPVDALKRKGGADEWVSSSADACEPYAVDIEVQHEPSCASAGVEDEITLFPDFRWDSLEFDLREATISATGRCNAVEPTITRE
jgi:hypothetical protein